MYPANSAKKIFVMRHETSPENQTNSNLFLQDFEVVDNEDSAEWEKEIEDMLEEENDIQ